jgi:hypothetical protein
MRWNYSTAADYKPWKAITYRQESVNGEIIVHTPPSTTHMKYRPPENTGQ